MISLPDIWKKEWEFETSGFDKLFNVKGEVFSESIGRKTVRFKFNGKYYFGKFHTGVGYKKIVKNLVQFRRPPVLGAENEWKAIKKLEELGIDTMKIVGYGKQGNNPATKRSFIITDELKNTITLEKLCQNWNITPPGEGLKQAIVKEVAKIARTIHKNGLNHRDLYICHFLLDSSMGDERIDPKSLRLYLADLHRAQIRSKTPFRWRAKDVSALLFSSMDLGLAKKDLLLFAVEYFSTTPERAVNENRLFWWIVKFRAKRLYKKTFGKNPP